MHKLWILPLLTLWVTACGGPEKKEYPSIADTHWQLHYLRQPLQTPLISHDLRVLSFSRDGVVSFDGACGTYSLNYESDSRHGTLLVRSDALTDKLMDGDCEGRAADSAYLEALSNTGFYRVENEQLILQDENRHSNLVMEQPFKGCEAPISLVDGQVSEALTVSFERKGFADYFTHLQNRRPDIRVDDMNSCSGVVTLRALPETVKRLQCEAQVLSFINEKNQVSAKRLAILKNREC